MTYLELINSVLDRLREARVESVSLDPYVRSIGAHVNDAKRLVEQAWDWSVFRATVDATTEDGDSSIELAESDNPDFTIKQVWNTSNLNAPVRERTLGWARLTIDPLASPQEGTVSNWWPESVSKTTGLRTVGIYPYSEGAQTLRFDVSYSQDALTDADTRLWVPSHPVVLLAAANAARERGEVGGANVAEWFTAARVALADAIAYDSAHHTEDLIYDAGYTWPSNNRM
jgi:hypothetical protein